MGCTFGLPGHGSNGRAGRAAARDRRGPWRADLGSVRREERTVHPDRAERCERHSIRSRRVVERRERRRARRDAEAHTCDQRSGSVEHVDLVTVIAQPETRPVQPADLQPTGAVPPNQLFVNATDEVVSVTNTADSPGASDVTPESATVLVKLLSSTRQFVRSTGLVPVFVNSNQSLPSAVLLARGATSVTRTRWRCTGGDAWRADLASVGRYERTAQTGLAERRDNAVGARRVVEARRRRRASPAEPNVTLATSVPAALNTFTPSPPLPRPRPDPATQPICRPEGGVPPNHAVPNAATRGLGRFHHEHHRLARRNRRHARDSPCIGEVVRVVIDPPVRQVDDGRAHVRELDPVVGERRAARPRERPP